MEPTTTVTELDVGQVEEVLDRVEQELGTETVRPLRLMLGWCHSIRALLQEKTLSMVRLRRMVFGPRGGIWSGFVFCFLVLLIALALAAVRDGAGWP